MINNIDITKNLYYLYLYYLYMSINTNTNANTNIPKEQIIKQEVINTKSTSISLEKLTMQYTNLLTQYKQAVVDYNTFLQENVSGSDSSLNQLGYIQSQAFWGKTILSQNISDSVDSCMASCATLSGCSGATYDLDSSLCYIISGNGKPVVSNQKHIAIMPESSILLMNIENLSNQLNYLNNQIQNLINEAQIEYSSETKQNTVGSTSLIEKYNMLLDERKKIEENIRASYTLDEATTLGSLYVNQNYYSFWLLMALAILFIFILMNFTISSNSNSHSNMQMGGDLMGGDLMGGDLMGSSLGISAYYVITFLLLCTIVIYFNTRKS